MNVGRGVKDKEVIFECMLYVYEIVINNKSQKEKPNIPTSKSSHFINIRLAQKSHDLER